MKCWRKTCRSGIAGAASSPVDVRVVNGIVSLRGTVRSKAERDLVLPPPSPSPASPR